MCAPFVTNYLFQYTQHDANKCEREKIQGNTLKFCRVLYTFITMYVKLVAADVRYHWLSGGRECYLVCHDIVYVGQ